MRHFKEGEILTREQVAMLIGKDVHDTNFKRGAETRFQSWGYKLKVTRKKCTIIASPDTIEKRIREIALRKFNLKTAADTKAFAFFIYKFYESEEYRSMPWQKRTDTLEEEFNIKISERTLRKYYSKLKNVIFFPDDSTVLNTYWKTTIQKNKKIQTKATKQEYQGFIDKIHSYENHAEITEHPQRSNIARSLYWQEFHTCYYPCRSIAVNGIQDEDIQELCELVNLLVLTSLDEREEKIILQ